MASVPPNPNLGKSQALNVAQTTVQRLATIVPTLTTQLSPVTVYQPGATDGVGNNLTASAGQPVNVNGSYGVWIAPDLYGNGQEYYVQVECFGAGGGGGGGSSAAGGGGGGGGEYACEPQYPVKPGASYAYVVGLPGTGGSNNSTQVNPGAAGINGGATLFDTDHGINANGLANGVVANGGQGGDQPAVGIGGAGGTGSTNSIHFDGGAGGTGVSGNGSDNPLSLAKTSGMFVGNTLSSSIIPCWYIFNEGEPTGGKVNDDSLNQNYGRVTNYTGGIALGGFTAPAQVPAYAAPADPPVLPVPQQTGVVAQITLGSLTNASSRITASTFSFSGSKLTVSCWIQCDPSGTWGNTAAGSYAMIASNTEGYNGNSLQGYALFLHQDGTPSSPSWSLNATVGNGTSRTLVTQRNLGQTPGAWYYVVMTYNSGTLTLYVNGSSAGTAVSSGYTSVPGGGFVTILAMDPSTVENWFFGSIANIWWANDCATSTLVTQAYGGAAVPTGGAGGGASGGPSAAGGTGGSAAGSAGGVAGVPATQPASLASTTTEAMSGFPGASAGSGFAASIKYGTSYTTVTKTAAGTYTQLLPDGVTEITSAACWAAGSGGYGGTTSAGGAGGSGGEYAAEATYTPLSNPFTYVVGAGGTASSTGNGAGGDGNDSFIDGTGIYANGGSAGAGGTGSTNTTHYNGGTGGAASAFTGGASGGNSGNASAAGTNGNSSTSSTHAGAPAGQTGSGTGGAGSDANSANPASIGGSPGGGGGGAGAGTSSQTTLTKTYEAVYTASYYGPDASGGNGNQLRSTSTLYQGGETSGGGSYNGNQRCVMVFNSNQIAEDFAGYTATAFSLKLTNQHSWYDSGMTIEIDVANPGGKYPGSAPGTWQDDTVFGWTTTIAEGATHTYALSAGVGQSFIDNSINFLALGAEVASDHPYNLSYYGYFAGGHGTSLQITITGEISTAGSETSGAGSDGKVTFTYADEAPYTPPAGTYGGSYGGGGGGSGDMPSSPALTVLTVPFSSAAAYCGPDAANGPGTPYSLNLQNNPASGVTSVLFAGGAATDTGSGSKNSILLLPSGLQAMLKNGSYTVEQVFITFTNAFRSSSIEPILELGYSSDMTLPQVYSGNTLVSYIGAIPIPAGAGTVTYDLSQSGIGALMQSGAATALVMGPGANPSFDAYNAPYGPGFYCSIYGPGAYDGFGNAQYPYLTIVLQKTLTVQCGSTGAGGAVIITAIDNQNVPVSSIQPYATTDENGNYMAAGYTGAVTVFDAPTTPVATIQGTAGSDPNNNAYAAGYTGPVSAYQPGVSPLAVETWHTMTLTNGWADSGGYAQYKLGSDNRVYIRGEAVTPGTLTNGTSIWSIPTGYIPVKQQPVVAIVRSGTTIGTVPRLEVTTGGQLQIEDFQSTTGSIYFSGSYSLD